MHSWRRLLTLAMVSAGIALLLPAGSAGKRPKTPPCGGRFIVRGPLLQEAGSTIPDFLGVEGRLIEIPNVCPPRQGRVRVMRNGTKVKVQWPNCGSVQAVKLTAIIAPACDSLRVAVKARKRPREEFTAALS